MSLKKILEQIAVNRPNAEADVSIGNQSTFRAREGLKRAAIDNMKQLKLQYRKELLASAVFIVVTGVARDNFSDLAAGDSFGCFSTDPDALYKDLSSRISPKLFGKESMVGLFNIASNILEDKCLELDINEHFGVRYSEKYNAAVNSVEDFVPIIRNAINDQMGSEVVGINAIHSIVDQAINKGHDAVIAPVILNTGDEKFALDLYKNLKRRKLPDGMMAGLTDRVFLITAGKASKALGGNGAIHVKTVSEESVGEALATIRSKIL